MTLEKAIKYKKEKRKKYYKGKAVSKQCRNHGACDWCRENRLYSSKVREMKFKEEK